MRRYPKSKEDLRRNFLSAIQTANILGIGSHDAMGKLIKDGILNPVRVHGRIYFYRDSVFRIRRNIEARELIPSKRDRMNIIVYKRKRKERANLVALKRRNLNSKVVDGDIEWALDFLVNRRIMW